MCWSNKAERILGDLDLSSSLHSQLEDAFALPDSPFVLASLSPPLPLQSLTEKSQRPLFRSMHDMSAVQQATTLQSKSGGPSAFAALTGARGLPRATASPLFKLRTESPEDFARTSRISMVSSFLCTLLCADGTIKATDESDAAGTQLWDVRGRRWDPKLCVEVGGPEGLLRKKLGAVELDGGKVVGTVGEWVSGRFSSSSQRGLLTSRVFCSLSLVMGLTEASRGRIRAVEVS